MLLNIMVIMIKFENIIDDIIKCYKLVLLKKKAN
jgi:hypothetical protein